MLIKTRFGKLLVSLLIIYAGWSIVVNLTNLHRCVDNDALVPCLFLLPPLGFLVIGFVAIKLIESAVVITFLKKFFRRKNTKEIDRDS